MEDPRVAAPRDPPGGLLRGSPPWDSPGLPGDRSKLDCFKLASYPTPRRKLDCYRLTTSRPHIDWVWGEILGAASQLKKQTSFSGGATGVTSHQP